MPRGHEKHVLVVGPNDFTRRHLAALPDAERYRFTPVIDCGELISNHPTPFDELFERIEAVVAREHVDGIISPWDFPGTLLCALVAQTHGLPTPGLEASVKCEHKYWSRCLQRECVPGAVPAFERVDPFDDDAAAKVTLPYPFWLKPIKSASSVLGFRIESDEDFERAIDRTRERIHIYADSFAQAVRRIPDPPGIDLHNTRVCLAEQIIGGRQVTVEGYVQGGEIRVHGVVDSLRQSNGSTFSRYQYPSKLDLQVIEQMCDCAATVLTHIGYDNGTFNIEYFYDEHTRDIWLVEINPRISQSHAALFQLVDGAPNFSEMVSVAVGRTPPPRSRGRYARAAKLFYRTVLEDAVVTAVPSPAEVEAIEHDIPGVEIQICVEVEQRLSDLPCQDSYTFELALIHIGGDTEGEILQKYQECVDRLTFNFRNMRDVDRHDGHHRVRATRDLMSPDVHEASRGR